MKVLLRLNWPDKSLMPNRKNGRHWSVSQAAKVAARKEAWAVTCAQVIDKDRLCERDSYTLTVSFYPPDKRRRDVDNLIAALKPHFDGIAQALGVDDSQFRLVIEPLCEPVKGGAVLVEVE